MTAPQAPKTYGDRRMTADDIAALPPGERTQYLERYMSPQDRLNYLQDSANAQHANDPGFLRWLEQIQASANAQQQANQYGQQSVQQATSYDTQYVSGLAPSNTNYKAVDHTELQGYVDNGLDAGQIGTLSTNYHEVSAGFDDIATTLNEAVNKSQSEWEGNAADSARGFFTSLQQWSDGNSQNARLASEVTYQQSTAAETAKNNMPAPIPFNMNDEMKNWFSNPFTIGDKIQESMDKAQQSQDAHDQAVQVMSTYDNNLFTAASKQPVFAEPPKFEPPGSVDTGQLTGNVNSTQTSGYAGHTGAGGGGGGGLSMPSGGGGAGSVSGALSGTGMPLGAGAITGSNSTRAQGYQPPGLNSPSSSSNNGPNPQNTMGGMPMMPMTGGMSGGGDESYAGRGGRGGGFGPGGGAGAGAGGAGGAASEGARTGLRAGGAGAAEAAGAAGGRGGAAGARGASGMGGMGGARGGQGSEDEEHQRPSWLVEADPDEVFGTSERTAPPVIGE